jgi:hypothetical protein
MSEKLKHPINIKLTDRQYEYFTFICFMQKKKVSGVLRDFIDEYIEKNIDIIKHDQTHYQILVEEKGKRKWIEVTEEEEKRDYENIGTDGQALFRKRKVKKA